MPSLYLHLGIALDAAPSLRGLGDRLGSFLFGVTLPDIQIITSQARKDTHFFELGEETAEKNLLQRFQSRFPAVGEAQRALGAGYLCHLASDIAWVKDIYNPFFSPSSLLRDDPYVQLLDRTLQFELDLRERRDPSRFSLIRHSLSQPPEELAPSWIDPADLSRWQQVVMRLLDREVGWQAFPDFLRNFLIYKKKVRPDKAEEFLTSLPAMIERVLNYVPEEKVQAFRKRAVDFSANIAQEYLGQNLG